jgi:hypothetical protein
MVGKLTISIVVEILIHLLVVLPGQGKYAALWGIQSLGKKNARAPVSIFTLVNIWGKLSRANSS